MNGARFLFVAAIAACCAGRAGAQAFNVDTDLFNSSSQVGGGAPSSSFGAAAGQTGVWNPFPTDDHDEPFNLLTTSGAFTGVTVMAEGTGGGGGWNNPVNTGDFNLLLNDADTVGNGFRYIINGLAAGHYLIYTYSVDPSPGRYGQADITISGASSPETVRVQGVMPGNSFQVGVTHSIHDIMFSGGALDIQVAGPWPTAFVNGFQIVPVPEPGTMFALSVGIAAILSRRKGRQAAKRLIDRGAGVSERMKD